MSELMSVLDTYAAVDVHALAEPVLLTETETLLAARDRIDGLLARRLQAADVRDVTVAERGRQTRSWLVEECRLSQPEAKRRMWVARQLPSHPQIADLLIAGEINHEHALVIINCLVKLPADWREPAEAELLTFAQAHDPTMLAALCRGLLVRTGADEDAQAAAERRHANRYLSLNTTIAGMVHLDGMLDPQSAAVVHAALGALCEATGPEDQRNSGQRTRRRARRTRQLLPQPRRPTRHRR